MDFQGPFRRHHSGLQVSGAIRKPQSMRAAEWRAFTRTHPQKIAFSKQYLQWWDTIRMCDQQSSPMAPATRTHRHHTVRTRPTGMAKAKEGMWLSIGNHAMKKAGFSSATGSANQRERGEPAHRDRKAMDSKASFIHCKTTFNHFTFGLLPTSSNVLTFKLLPTSSQLSFQPLGSEGGPLAPHKINRTNYPVTSVMP